MAVSMYVDGRPVSAKGFWVDDGGIPRLRRERTFGGGYPLSKSVGYYEQVPDTSYTVREITDYNVVPRGGTVTKKSVDKQVDRKTTYYNDNAVRTTELVDNRSYLGNGRHLDTRFRNIHPSLAAAILKEKLCSGQTEARSVFAPECFNNQGQIYPHQLRDALSAMHITLNDDNFTKLWHRYDKNHIGALRTRQFFREVGLDLSGDPPVRSTHTEVVVKPPFSRVREVTDIRETTVTEERPMTLVQPVRSTVLVEKPSPSYRIVSDVRQGDLVPEVRQTVLVPEVRQSVLHNPVVTEVVRQPLYTDRQPVVTEVISVPEARRTVTIGDVTHEKVVRRPLYSEQPLVTEVVSVPEAQMTVDDGLHEQHLRRQLEDELRDTRNRDFSDRSQAILAGFRLFDTGRTGYVSRNNFNKVLREFGVSAPPSANKTGVSWSIRGDKINYMDFLSGYKARNHITNNHPTINHSVNNHPAINHCVNNHPAVNYNVKDLTATNLPVSNHHDCVHPRAPYYTEPQSVRVTRWPQDQSTSSTRHVLVPVQDTSPSGVQFVAGHRSREDEAYTEAEVTLRAALMKIKREVLRQKDYLRTYFQSRDRSGLLHIGAAEMKSLMDRLYFPLSTQEKENLVYVFDYNNNGRFHYKSFMDHMMAL